MSRLQREKNDIQSRFEEDQEDMNELMKKHKAAVAQVTSLPVYVTWPHTHIFRVKITVCVCVVYKRSGANQRPANPAGGSFEGKTRDPGQGTNMLLKAEKVKQRLSA